MSILGCGYFARNNNNNYSMKNLNSTHYCGAHPRSPQWRMNNYRLPACKSSKWRMRNNKFSLPGLIRIFSWRWCESCHSSSLKIFASSSTYRTTPEVLANRPRSLRTRQRQSVSQINVPCIIHAAGPVLELWDRTLQKGLTEWLLQDLHYYHIQKSKNVVPHNLSLEGT